MNGHAAATPCTLIRDALGTPGRRALTVILQATLPAQVATAGRMFSDYAASLEIDLGFQDFAAELAELPGEYTPPFGALLLAMDGGDALGCVALRPLEPPLIAELKRLYVAPTARGGRLGVRLTEAALATARSAGYARVRLDTLPSMQAALHLYERLGFRDIVAYRHNPIHGARYLELGLWGGRLTNGGDPVTIRSEEPQDREAIRRVNVAAFADHQFSRQTEHLIIEALRAADALDVSLIADLDGEVVGHIAFSRAQIGDTESGWFLLGPVAVLPDHQARGIGRELVEAGLGALRSRGAGGCVLVGDPAFYTRFGFTQIPGVTWAGVPAENVLCLRISGPAPAGEVTCHPAFSVGPEQEPSGGQR